MRGLGGAVVAIAIEGAMEAMLKVVVEPRPGSKSKKKKNATASPSSSSRYPSMPRYPPSPPHGKVDVSEIRTATFKVTGMECAACAGSTEKSIKRLPGIEEAIVAVLQNRAQVIYRPAFVHQSTILESISDAGFEASVIFDDLVQSSKTTNSRFRIKGMTCTSCSTSIESSLQKLPGVQSASVALATEACEVRHDAGVLSREEIVSFIDELGYDAEVLSFEEEVNRVRLLLEDVSDFQLVEEVLNAVNGVKFVVVDPIGGTVTVEYDPEKAGPRSFIENGGGAFKAKLEPPPGS